MVACLYGNRETGEQEETDEFQQKLIWTPFEKEFSVLLVTKVADATIASI